MAITKKLIHFNQFSNFNTQKLSANRENTAYTVGVGGTVTTGEPYILYHSIVFIKDVLKIWTHGSLYDCGETDLSDYLTADEIAEVYATIEALNGKQDKITDLETIRSGAAKGATAIQSHQDISGKLDKAEAASTYLTKTGASDTYLGKTANAASATKATQDASGNVITSTYATKTELSAKGTYSKPSGGIPMTDLASEVQTSLGKADTALQNHQDISGKISGDGNITNIAVVSALPSSPNAKTMYVVLASS